MLASVRLRLRRKGTRVALLQFGGFTAISVALGMWLVPVGIAAAGVSLLIMSALLDE